MPPPLKSGLAEDARRFKEAAEKEASGSTARELLLRAERAKPRPRHIWTIG